MTRVPVRWRLAVAFATALLLVLGVTAVVVHVRLRAELTDGVDTTLRSRLQTVSALSDGSGPVLPPRLVGEAEEGFAQLLDRDGELTASAGGAGAVVLTDAEVRQARSGRVRIERAVAGIEGRARVLAGPTADGVAVVGQSLEDRDEVLAAQRAGFLVGVPLAALLAALLGYLLAAAALRPVEEMRRRAATLSLAADEPLLPLPRAHDELRRLGETLNAMLARLRDSVERERRFVADASHELRTPIAVVRTELENALRAPDCPPSVREALDGGVAECDRLAQLAEDLLVLAATADGRLSVRPATLPAQELLRSLVDRYGDRAARGGRRIVVDAEPGCVLQVDPLLIRQALGNLVDNALRHGAGDVVVRAGREGEATVVEVADSGPGLGPDLAAVATERFTRGDAARSEGGAGLGLSIVDAIATAHGGGLEVEPDGRRAVLRLCLPRSQEGLRSSA
jgi:signal transduction histidine kinase